MRKFFSIIREEGIRGSLWAGLLWIWGYILPILALVGGAAMITIATVATTVAGLRFYEIFLGGLAALVLGLLALFLIVFGIRNEWKRTRFRDWKPKWTRTTKIHESIACELRHITEPETKAIRFAAEILDDGTYVSRNTYVEIEQDPSGLGNAESYTEITLLIENRTHLVIKAGAEVSGNLLLNGETLRDPKITPTNGTRIHQGNRGRLTIRQFFGEGAMNVITRQGEDAQFGLRHLYISIYVEYPNGRTLGYRLELPCEIPLRTELDHPTSAEETEQ